MYRSYYNGMFTSFPPKHLANFLSFMGLPGEDPRYHHEITQYWLLTHNLVAEV